MRWFIFLYLALYGGMNGYCLWRCGGALHFKPWQWLLASATVALLVFLPILLNLADRYLSFRVGRVLALVGLSWMAVAFWLTCLLAGADIWNLGVGLAALGHASWLRWRLPAQAALAGAGVLIVAAMVWGFFEASRIRLRTIVIETPKIARTARPVRVAVISDLHVGRTSRQGVIERVVARIQEAAPDVLVSAGDLIDAAGDEVGDMLKPFAAVRPRWGKFAVIGNHEVYPGLAACQTLLEGAGFEVLRDTSVHIGASLELRGVDDPAVAHWRPDRPLPAEPAHPGARASDRFIMLVKHQPRIAAAARTGCDLQVSGHTHAGQIFPFGLIVHLFYPFRHGSLQSLDGGLQVYVSSGCGTWGPPFRVFAPPEVVLFILEPAVLGGVPLGAPASSPAMKSRPDGQRSRGGGPPAPGTGDEFWSPPSSAVFPWERRRPRRQ